MALWQISGINNIDDGVTPNDGTGDSIRDAFIKVGDNFANVSSFLSNPQVDFLAANIQNNLTANLSTISTLNTSTLNSANSQLQTATISNLTSANLAVFNGQTTINGEIDFYGVVKTHAPIVPSANLLYDLGSPTNYFRNIYAAGLTQVSTVSASSDAGLLELHANLVPGDIKDVGILGKYNQTGSNSYAFFGFQHATDNFVYKQTNTDATQGNSIVFDGVYGNTQFGSQFLSNVTNATSQTTGTLIVGGGAGFGGDVYARSFTGNVSAPVANIGRMNVTGTISGNLSVDGTIYANGAMVITSSSLGAYGTVYAGGSVVGNQIFLSTTQSTSPSTGSIVALGGVGIGGNVFAGGLNGPYYGAVQTASQPNITSVGTLGNLVVTGQSNFNSIQATSLGITNITATGNVNVTNINGLSSLLLSGNVTSGGFVGSLYGTVQTAAQPNITSVGTLTSLTTGGAINGVTAAQYDNTTKMASTAFVQRALGNHSGFIGVNAAQTLTAAMAGSVIQFGGGSAFTVMLPESVSVVAGGTYTFYNNSLINVTVQCQSDNFIYVQQSVTNRTVVLYPEDTLVLVSRGSNEWDVIGGTAYLPFSGVMSQPVWTTPPQFDNSAKLATTAFVARNTGVLSTNIVGISTNTTLTQSQSGMFGEISNGSTIMLPSVAGYLTYTLWGLNAWTLSCGTGANIFFGGNGTASLAVQGGCPLEIACDGANWVVTEYSGMSPTAPQFDNSTRTATTAFVTGALGNFPQNSGVGLQTNSVLTASQAGNWFEIQQPYLTITLPDIGTLPVGKVFTFMAEYNATIQTYGGQMISQIAAAASAVYSILRGQSIQIVSNNTTGWYIFNSSFDTSVVALQNYPVFSGQVLMPEGTSSVPGLSFVNDGAPDTGFYHFGDGSFGITNNTSVTVTYSPSLITVFKPITSNNPITATAFNGTLNGTATNALQLGGIVASSYAQLNNPTFSGLLTIPSAAGVNLFKAGTGDGASYSTFNLNMQGWQGMGMSSYDGTVHGYYDFRQGIWDTLGGFKVNGVPVPTINAPSLNGPVTINTSGNGLLVTGSSSGNIAAIITNTNAAGFAQLQISSTGTNASKFIRVSSGSGNLELVNSAYTGVIFSVSDAGVVSCASNNQPLYISSNNSANQKIVLANNGTTVGYIGASSTNQLASYNASSVLGFNVDQSGNGTFAGNVNAQQVNATSYSNLPQTLGVGQTWQNVTGSRFVNTVYSNNTSAPIQVMLAAYDVLNVAWAFTVGGVTIQWVGAGSATGITATTTFIVPVGVTYSASGFSNWYELR